MASGSEAETGTGHVGGLGVFPPPAMERVLFAVPKKGRLAEKVKDLLKGAGVNYVRPDRLDVADVKDLNVTLVFLPCADIPRYVGEGNVDIGITGLDCLEEAKANGVAEGAVVEVMRLGFGQCRLCVQAPVTEGAMAAPADFVGKRVVTSFPGLTRDFFDKLDPSRAGSTAIKNVTGSVEVACSLGLADAVVDLVETGTTMRAAGLEVVGEVLKSETVLIHGTHARAAAHAGLVELLEKRIQGYLAANKFFLIKYNVQHENLEACKKITPGKRAPTIFSLSEDGWCALEALVEQKQAAAVMDQLTKIGAKDILLVTLANTRD
eukprot:CAMPEP_0204255440 /NCGR_PEP_ID=MMETSP0468-20130131/3227_1 /ASSEMBLY_ACC=CAM_ASM_000383 /TAXON_ID=2969 /ORGANISM="Oxyrrhis marina" /LENGTH=321 /DNA_ID=CAMNT_0051229329 /DNA_START=36 /DNA_END=1001 /DNA_ORIENTATION=+